jgi:hypothetical protein
MYKVGQFIVWGLVAFLIYQMVQCSQEQAAYDARPEVVAERAREQAARHAKTLADAAVTRRMDATAAMTDNPTLENVAEWEAANRAVDGPDWEGDWQAEVTANRGYWAQAYAEDQARQLQRELKERPVIVVVQRGN